MRVARLSVMALFPVMLGPTLAAADEPPRVSVRDLLSRGRLAFWGRLTRAEIAREDVFDTIGRMHFSITECFYGECRNRKTATLLYHIGAVEGDQRPIAAVSVGSEALVILNSFDRCDDVLLDSSSKTTADYVFFGAPPYWARYEKNLINGYGARRQGETVTMEQLRAWSKRQAQ